MCDALELIVWYDAMGETIRGFQICYPHGGRHYALTLREKQTLTHSVIDTGSAPPFEIQSYKGSPVLREGEKLSLEAIAELFAAVSASLPSEIQQWVQEGLSGGKRRI